MPPELDEWIARIRSRDAMTFEDAYAGDRPFGPGVVTRLIDEMQSAADAYTRGKFAELLGEMGDASAVPALIEELRIAGPDEEHWAVTALEQLGVPEGINALE